MKKLLNRSKSNSEVASQVDVADSLYSRVKGLMFDRSMPPNSALWIKGCRSIHTSFMNFSIDAIFVDHNLVVKRIYRELKPWRMTRVVWPADSVLELPGGTLKNIDIGDELYVGD